MTRPTSNKANGISRSHKAETNPSTAAVDASPSSSPPAHAHAHAHGTPASRAAGRGARERDVCGPDEHARRARLSLVSDDQLERAASIFRAAGDVSRLKLLHRLSDGEWCVTELAEAAPPSRSSSACSAPNASSRDAGPESTSSTPSRTHT